jgi:hypothetical protein
MIAHPLPAVIVWDAGKNIKARLKPRCPSLSNFYGFVPSALRWQYAVHRIFRPGDGVVAVQLDHGTARGDGFGTVYLNFIIVLSSCGSTKDYEQREA